MYIVNKKYKPNKNSMKGRKKMIKKMIKRMIIKHQIKKEMKTIQQQRAQAIKKLKAIAGV